MTGEIQTTLWLRLKCLFGFHVLKAPIWAPTDAAGFITRSHFIATCAYCAHRREVYVTD